MNVKICYPKQAISFFMAACIFAAAFGQGKETVQAGPPATGDAKITLKMGDDAPAIQYARWLKGTPVAAFEKSKIYVVEFWATWCGPCAEAMPHLSGMAKKYAGKVTFASFDVNERTSKSYDETLDNVAKFVQAKGDKMSYNVGADTKDGFMNKNWLEATGVPGIPVAYIVQNNKIIWIGIGYPTPLDSTLGEVLSGKYDMQAYANAYNKLYNKLMEDQNKARGVQEIVKPVMDALNAKDVPKALAELDKVKPKLSPQEWTGTNANIFSRLLASKTESTTLIDFLKKWHDQDAPNALIASYLGALSISRTDSLSPALYQLALEYAKEFSSSGKKPPYYNYSLLARCYNRLHNIPEALAQEQKALDSVKEALAAKKPGDDTADLEQAIKVLEAGIEKYKSALK